MRQLAMSGFICDAARNGQEAVDKFLVNTYDLIFMDAVCVLIIYFIIY